MGPGTVLAERYELEEELGRGGMGVVYLARDRRLDREVAVKVIATAQLDDVKRERFLREARVVAQLDHPSIVAAFDVGEHDGAPFLVMPRVRGVSLRALVEEQRDLTVNEVIDVGVQVSAALGYAHQRDVVHRDVKPENILVEGRGAALRARLTDFGLALASNEARMTNSGALLGTVGYHSPEQILDTEVDGRSDVYALATVIYECLAGQMPFAGAVQGILYRIVHTPAPPLTEVAKVDPALAHVLMTCLEKEPASRPTAQRMSEALERYQSHSQTDELELATLATVSLERVRGDGGAPFVGRVEEMGELERRLKAALAGSCQLVLVGGEQGVGKTRLLEELETLARMEHARVLVAHFGEREQLPFQGYREIIEQYCREHSADLSSELTGDDQDELFEQLAATFTQIASEAPLVAILENLDDASVSVRALHYLVQRLANSPILFVGSYATTEVDAKHPIADLIEALAGSRRFSRLILGGLSQQTHRKLVASLTMGRPLDDAGLERVFELTEGNPYFTVELLRSLDASSGSGSGTSSAGGTQLSYDAMPASIQQAIERRLVRLDADLREVLTVASVLGPSFDYRDLEAMVEDERKLEDGIEALIRHGFLREERRARGDVIAFTSRATQGMLHAGLSRRRRRRLHRAAADAIEKRSGRRIGAAAMLLTHYAEADDAERVFELGLLVAEHALDTFSPADAMAATATVIELAAEHDAQVEGRARTLLAAAHRLQGNSAEALLQLDQAVRLIDGAHNESWLADALAAAVETAWESRRMNDTERFIGPALKLVADPERRRSLLTIAAMLDNLHGRGERAATYEKELRELASSREASALPPHGAQQLGPPLAAPNDGHLGTLDPVLVRYYSESWIVVSVVETLTAEGEGGEVSPWLAERIEAVDGGRRYRVHLRTDVRFHDGRPMTSADVRFSLSRLLRTGTQPNRAVLADVVGATEMIEGRSSELSGVVVESDHELTIALVKPTAILPALLAHPCTSIVPSDTADPDVSIDAMLCGTGPFRLHSFLPSRRVELEANADYWRAGLPRSRGLMIMHGISREEALEGLLDETFALIGDVTDEELTRLRADPRGIHRVLVQTPLLTCFAVLNASAGVLVDPALRHNVVAAIDASRVAARLGTGAVEARTLLPPGMLAGRVAVGSRTSGELAPLDLELRIGCARSYWTRYRAAMDEVVEQLRNAGATVVVGELLEQDRPRWSEMFDVTLAQFSADYPDPDGMLHVMRRRSGVHGALCGSGRLDDMIDTARGTTDPVERERQYRDIELLLEDDARLLPLFHPTRRTVLGRRVRTTAKKRLLVRAADCAELWIPARR